MSFIRFYIFKDFDVSNTIQAVNLGYESVDYMIWFLCMVVNNKCINRQKHTNK